MRDRAALAPLLRLLADLDAWLADAEVPGVVIGGVAASLLGRPRATRDVDALVLVRPEGWDGFVVAGANHGFQPRIADVLAFAHESRVLLLRHEPSHLDLDVSLAALPFESECLARATEVDVGGVTVRLPTPEDLVILKAVAHRPRDLSDIEGVVAAHPELDVARIKHWVGEFAAVLEMPELLRDVEARLATGDRESQ